MRRFGRLFAVEAIARKKELGPGGVTMLAALAVLMTLAYSGCTDSSNAPKFQEYNALVVGGGACVPSISDYTLMTALTRSGDVEAFRSLMNQGRILPLAEMTGVRVWDTNAEGRATVYVLTGAYIQKSCYMPANLLTDPNKVEAAAAKARADEASAVAAKKLGPHEALVGTHSVVGCAISLQDNKLLSQAISSEDMETENALVSRGRVLALKGNVTRVRELNTNADGLSRVTVLNGPHTGKTCWMPATTLLK